MRVLLIAYEIIYNGSFVGIVLLETCHMLSFSSKYHANNSMTTYALILGILSLILLLAQKIIVYIIIGKYAKLEYNMFVAFVMPMIFVSICGIMPRLKMPLFDDVRLNTLALAFYIIAGLIYGGHIIFWNYWRFESSS